MNYRGRLAPTPTGYLHLGHARSFWIAHERAQAADGAAVDVAAVDALLAERVQMKRRRLFAAADAIRDALQRVHGVSVWARERVWSTGRGGGRSRRRGAALA